MSRAMPLPGLGRLPNSDLGAFFAQRPSSRSRCAGIRGWNRRPPALRDASEPDIFLSIPYNHSASQNGGDRLRQGP